ncbi:hypothetical protein [Hymenobacter jeollabukensis]|uniref:Uncharacterized protein n=1 Tax=Hymenobacter jeollabukensis TaxID=2025313 RepID=A0A5R8WS55_9BACT|nr:hypothetical protein [Hymenobacter jeollabukensis]TLM94024.1 hypothetical protein FDY95_08310 [Hymenobacter jeollabukensis]
MPTTHTYFANALGAVLYVPDAYLTLRWTDQPLSSHEWRALYVHARNLLERAGLRGVLADHRAATAPPTAADQQWLLTRWLPDVATRTGLVRYAALPAPNPSHRLHTGPVVHDLRRFLTVGLFDDPAPAADWLRAA